MRYEKVENLLLKISMSLEASATYWPIEIIEGKWILRVMKEFFLDTLQTAEHIEFSIPKPRLSWNISRS